MDQPRTPAQALELIEYLVAKGKRPNSFENAFPYIHHFKGGNGSLNRARSPLSEVMVPIIAHLFVVGKTHERIQCNYIHRTSWLAGSCCYENRSDRIE